VMDPGSPEDELARDLLVEKYQPGYGGDLGGWRRPSLAVAIDLETRPMAEPGRAWTVEAANAGLPRVREVLERIRGPRQVRTIATGSCRGQRSRCWSWRPRSV
jgi:hypothetical protein